MGAGGFGERGSWAVWTLVACLMMTAATLATGCASDEAAGEESGQAATVPFPGRLVFTDGTDIVALDGQTGETARIGAVDGEIGWSGFERLTAEGQVIYESLSGAESRLLMTGDGAENRVLASDVSLLHHFSDDTVLASDTDDTFTAASAGNEPRRLGVGPSLDGILSSDRTEFLYVAAVPSDDATTSVGEPAQAAFVRALDGTGTGEQVATGSFAILPLTLDARAVVYAAHPFGGSDEADIVLYDRRSTEETIVASGVRVLDTDAHRGLIAVQSLADGERISIIDVHDPAAVTTTVFDQPSSGVASWGRLTGSGGSIIVAFTHGSSASLVRYDAADRSSQQIAMLDGFLVNQLLVHPGAPVSFVLLERIATTEGAADRSIAVCDLASAKIETLVDVANGASLRLIGVID